MSSDINNHQPHDTFFKQSMSRLKVAKEFFAMHLPQGIKDRVDLNTLKPQQDSFIDAVLGKGAVDMLFSVKFNGELGYFYLLVEHQSNPDYWMSFRLLKYMIQISEKHLKDHPKSKHLPFIYPSVFYTGKKNYTAPQDIWSLFTDPSLAKKLYTEPFQLINLQAIEDDVLRQKIWAGVMQYVMKRVFEKEFLPFLKNIQELIRRVSEEDFRYTEDILWYTLKTAETKTTEEVLNIFKEAVTDEYKGDIMSIADRLIEQGIQQGLQRGMEQGVQRGRAEGREEGIQYGERRLTEALAMLNDGKDTSSICKATGLAESKVKELQELYYKRH